MVEASWTRRWWKPLSLAGAGDSTDLQVVEVPLTRIWWKLISGTGDRGSSVLSLTYNRALALALKNIIKIYLDFLLFFTS